MFSRLSSKFFFLILSVLIIGLSLSGLQKSKKADLVLMNGKIVTVDDAKPEAQALAASGDRIIAVGSNEEIKPYITQKTEVIDLEGKLAIPGFIDAHGHFTSLGRSKMVLNFMNIKNWDKVVAMTKEAVKKAKPGEWIFGRGWHQEKWDELQRKHKIHQEEKL